MGKINEYNKTLTSEERKANASEAGKASGQARKERAKIKRYLLALLDSKVEIEIDGKNKKVRGAERIALVAFQGALNGDWKAWELVRDTAGQKPAELLIMPKIDEKIIDEVETAVKEAEAEINAEAN